MFGGLWSLLLTQRQKQPCCLHRAWQPAGCNGCRNSGSAEVEGNQTGCGDGVMSAGQMKGCRRRDEWFSHPDIPEERKRRVDLHLLLLHFHLLQLFSSEIHKTCFKICSWLIVQLFLLLIVYKMALIPKQLMPKFKSGHGKVTTTNLLIWFLEIREFF